MPEIYVHLSGGDVKRKMLQKAGFMEGGNIKQGCGAHAQGMSSLQDNESLGWDVLYQLFDGTECKSNVDG